MNVKVSEIREVAKNAFGKLVYLHHLSTHFRSCLQYVHNATESFQFLIHFHRCIRAYRVTLCCFTGNSASLSNLYLAKRGYAIRWRPLHPFSHRRARGENLDNTSTYLQFLVYGSYLNS